jgi:NAD(P)-dependent dehydrogenase (short-subunit alcohol dehydrogenase family)
MLGARRVQLIDKIADEIGDAALAVPMDVADEVSVIAAYDKAEARFGRVDTVIAHAGVEGSGKAVDMPLAVFRQTLDIYLTGTFLTARKGAIRGINVNAIAPTIFAPGLVRTGSTHRVVRSRNRALPADA